MNNLVILTGGRNSGKTQVLSRLIQYLNSEGYNLFSILAESDFNSKNELYLNINGRRESFAKRPENAEYGYIFDITKFGLSKKKFDENSRYDYIIIDEIGNLELNNDGFSVLLESVADSIYNSCVLSVRKSILNEFIIKYSVKAEIIDLDVISAENAFDLLIKKIIISMKFIKYGAAILAGGKSSRMGNNKSMLELNGQSFIGHALELAGSIFQNVMIIGNDENLQHGNFLQIDDIYEGRGPLSGLYSALKVSKSDGVFLLPVDMPFLNVELINYILKNDSGQSKVTLAADKGNIQYVCGIYKKEVIELAQKLLESAQDYTPGLKKLYTVEEINIVETSRADFYKPHLFFNVNTPQEFEMAQKLAGVL